VIQFELRAECARCGRPQVTCYCDSVTPVPTRTRVLMLQHPREHGKAVNTARIAALALPSSTLHVGIDFADTPEVIEAISDPSHPAVLLYPGPDASDLERLPPAGPVTLVVIDGTWHQARALLRKNPRIAALPRYAFTPPRPSEYRIRKEPSPECVSTIEALAHALPLLEGDRARFAALLEPFRAMVDFQLTYVARSSGGRRRMRRRDGRSATSASARLPRELLDARLVCVAGEANAWPHDRALGMPAHPHELVHWLGYRLDRGTRYESIMKPRKPLASSPIVHARLSESALRAGCSVADTLRSFADFAGDDDVICVWGHYAASLYLRERGGAFARIVDIRKVVGDFLKGRPGSVESVVAEQGLTYEPLGQGRGGERLGMLVAVTRWLAEHARGDTVELETDGAAAVEHDLTV
jgi:DTW domain-containing protein